MTDLATLQGYLAKLEKARASGVSTVRHGDIQTTWRSLDELERIIAAVKAEIAGAENKPRRRVRYLYQGGKGL